MELYVDSGDIAKIKELKSWLPLAGVTVNPSIIAAENQELFSLLQELIILSNKHLHVQVLSNDTKGIIKEAQKLHSFSDKIVVKIPVSQAGLAAIKELDPTKIKITATAIFTVSQAFTAAEAGAVYLAPYVSRLDKIEQEGVKMVREMKEMLLANGFSARIIAASIKNSQQVKELIKLGIGAITLTPDILIQMNQHPLTDQAIAAFKSDWLIKFKDYELDSKLRQS